MAYGIKHAELNDGLDVHFNLFSPSRHYSFAVEIFYFQRILIHSLRHWHQQIDITLKSVHDLTVHFTGNLIVHRNIENASKSIILFKLKL